MLLFMWGRPWLKVAHGSPELLDELKSFLLENPEALAACACVHPLPHYETTLTPKIEYSKHGTARKWDMLVVRSAG